jgi:hypothetical protein
VTSGDGNEGRIDLEAARTRHIGTGEAMNHDNEALLSRTADGKIVEAWEQLDMLGMWPQLGVVSLPGHE